MNHYRNNFTHQYGPKLDPRALPDHWALHHRQFNVNHRFSPAAHPLMEATNHHGNYWCETCDRGFYNKELLEKHNQQHQKCNIDGCTFVAHPKVITKHIQMQHSTGLYSKIAKLNNPEEIRKWLEDRKKKYPTKLHIEKKAAELKEKIQRGEKMGINIDKRRNFSTERDTSLYRNRKNGLQNEYNIDKKYIRKNHQSNSMNKVKKVQKNTFLPAGDIKRTLKPFAGIQEIMHDDVDEIETTDCTFSIEDDHDESEMTKETDTSNIINPLICSVLSSLICDYGSSDDDTGINKHNETMECNQLISRQLSTTENKDIGANVKLGNGNRTKNTEVNSNKSDDDSGPEELTIVKQCDSQDIPSPPKNPSTIQREKVKLNVQRTKKCIHLKPKPKPPSTLLRKLLHKEMHQERNIVLQCIRYIRNNDYFDKKH